MIYSGHGMNYAIKDLMQTSTRLALGFAVLLVASRSFAADDLRTDLVVDLTDAGRKFRPATPEHPAYYYPAVRGYTPSGAILAGEKAPPPEDVEHLIARALAKQGYRLMTSQHPPSLLLMFWWGYKAPEIRDDHIEGAWTGKLSILQQIQQGKINTGQSVNGGEMEELVFGSSYAADTPGGQANPSARWQTLVQESRIPRYYVMISALDFDAATRHKETIVLWTARISTGQWAHTLDEVLPTLLDRMAPQLGRATDGPMLLSAPALPMGHVEVGKPYVRTDPGGPAAAPANQ